MSLTCLECNKPAQYLRRTQFSGDHPYCLECAKKEKDFLKEDPSYYFWVDISLEYNSRLKYHFNSQFVFFLKGPLSQWSSSPFYEDDQLFETCEQYMMYHKAMLFKDLDISEEILNNPKSPKICKDLGRQVKNYKQKEWDIVKENIVFNGNYLKFTYNKDYKQILLETDDRELVEVNSVDRIWGIGLSIESPNLFNRLMWGQNLLGKALMKVREEIKKLPKNKKEDPPAGYII